MSRIEPAHNHLHVRVPKSVDGPVVLVMTFEEPTLWVDQISYTPEYDATTQVTSTVFMEDQENWDCLYDQLLVRRSDLIPVPGAKDEFIVNYDRVLAWRDVE